MKYLVYAMLMIKVLTPISHGIENTLTVQKANTILQVEEGDSYSRCVFGMSIGNGYAVMTNPCP